MILESEPREPARAAIDATYTADEAVCVQRLLPAAVLEPAARARVEQRARALVAAVRAHPPAGLAAFLQEYNLSTDEGVALMCMAEALLRIPDVATADRLIEDRLATPGWDKHLGRSDSLWVNAATWALLLTGYMVRSGAPGMTGLDTLLPRMVARLGEPVARLALRQAMRILGGQFVMGATIEQALARARDPARPRENYSFDMLGEAALTARDGERYEAAYAYAIDAIGRDARDRGDGISVKLSALHPRFEFAQRARVLAELPPRLVALARQARAAGVQFTVDAEEADRLDITLDVFDAVYGDAGLAGWDGFGIAVQAYQKRALPVLEWLAGLARGARRRIPVRLVKGAYWDTEIKRAQERGFDDYPVYTRKSATDVSFLVCTRYLLAARDAFHCQFATHNAHTIAAIVELMGTHEGVEFQRLHGMGEALYDAARAHDVNVPCRVYAPVGAHADLLPYLVRRLLENGANTSFVHRIWDAGTPVDKLVADPVTQLQALSSTRHPRVPLPVDLYRAWRNSRGVNLDHAPSRVALSEAVQSAAARAWTAAPLVAGRVGSGTPHPATDPANRARVVGGVIEADAEAVDRAMESAASAQGDWARTPAAQRAETLERVADLFEARSTELITLLVREGGKCIPDAVAEVREAVDYCRYYAHRARVDFAAPATLPGPAGERNTLALHGRGVFACISPWNFPLAIFTGQVTAALAAGNSVLAKPARQTSLVAALATKLLHEGGVPVAVLHLLPGSGARIGEQLFRDARIGGVAMTGSTETAHAIAARLAARGGPIVPLIAETGGQNAMIADSSALPEQLVKDALTSAFNSAGQRCSALRVLYVQQDIAARVLDLLAGAMAELRVGDPAWLATDVGPMIDASAVAALTEHAQRMDRNGRLIYQVSLPADCTAGSFFAPRAFEIEHLSLLAGEVFGPILHVIRYRADQLDAVIAAINTTGYGLTLGIQTRVDATARYIIERARVGNIYVNRTQIGAVVGVQPFGGEGLSGTGPKAGGPHYLPRFALERTVSVNTAAAGGDPDLLSLD